MKPSYEIHMNEEQRNWKSLNLSRQDYHELPSNLDELFPILEHLDLSHNLLHEGCNEALQALILQCTHLKYLDISDNPLPSHVLFDLHELAEGKIELVSDMSLWIAANSHLEYRRITWALLPEQWVREYTCRDVFETIAKCWEDYPEHRPIFIEALKPIMKIKNMLGWTPLVCATQISTPIIANALIDILGIEEFTKQFIEACTADSVIYLIPEKFVPGLVHYSYLLHAKRSDLAFKLVQIFLPLTSAARNEALGNIALFEKDFDQAYEYYSAGAALGSSNSHYGLAMMMYNSQATHLLPYNVKEMNKHLITAADSGHVMALLDLGKAHEDANDLQTAYSHYEKAQAIIKSIHNYLHCLPTHTVQFYQTRFRFLEEVSIFINNLLIARVEQTYNRYLQLHPALDTFNKKGFYDKLCALLGNATMQKILTTLGLMLLKNYLTHDKTITELTVHAKISLEKAKTLNQGLLSMDPNEFSQAVAGTIDEYLVQHFGSMMQSGSVQKITNH